MKSPINPPLNHHSIPSPSPLPRHTTSWSASLPSAESRSGRRSTCSKRPSSSRLCWWILWWVSWDLLVIYWWIYWWFLGIYWWFIGICWWFMVIYWWFIGIYWDLLVIYKDLCGFNGIYWWFNDGFIGISWAFIGIYWWFNNGVMGYPIFKQTPVAINHRYLTQPKTGTFYPCLSVLGGSGYM